MFVRASRCEISRLRLLLEDRLPDNEQAELSAHLEGCESCRIALEEMAAARSWWDEARRFAGGGPSATDAEPAGKDDVPLDLLDPPNGPGQLGRLGPYEVTEVIGRGGMGVVFRAFDRPLGRFVAIKLLAPELATSAMARRRFAREAQAVAAVAHEHIVAVHAVDSTPAGLPLIVMHYVSGRSLQERLDAAGPLEVREILRIGMQAASGLAAAHAVGLVHRDVKPANILLEDGVGRVKLTDFGLARAADDASLTQSGVVAGTPQYMAPEQARGEPVDARADLFSLGSVLYAMCTGRPPFRAETTVGVLRRVCEDTPRPIGEFNPEIPDWLQAIIGKLMSKEPTGRFESAAEVAGLFGRCLAHTERPGGPPPFRVESPAPMGRRVRPRLVAVAALVILSIVVLGAAEASGVSSLTDYIATVLRIKTAQGTLILQIDDPEVKVRIDGEDVVLTEPGSREIRLSLRAGEHRIEKVKGGETIKDLITITRGGKQTVKISFESNAAALPLVPTGSAVPAQPQPYLPRVPGGSAVPEQPQLDSAPSALPRGMVLPAQPQLETTPRPVDPTDERHRDVDTRDAERKIHRADDERLRRRIKELETENQQIKSDHQRPMAGSGSGTIGVPKAPIIVLVPRAEGAAGPRMGPLTGVQQGGSSDAFQAGMGALPPNVGTPRSGKQPPPASKIIVEGHRIWSLAYSPDGETLAIGSSVASDSPATFGTERGALTLWKDGRTSWPFGEIGDCYIKVSGRSSRIVCLRPCGETEAGYVRFVAFSRDGKWLATAEIDGTAKLRDPSSGRIIRTLEGHRKGVNGVAFTPDSKTLLTAGLDGTVRLWDVETGRLLRELGGHEGSVYAVAVSPDGRVIASAGTDHSVRLWDFETSNAKAVLDGHRDAIEALAFSPDCKTLVSTSWDGTARLWNANDGRELTTLSGHTAAVLGAAFSPDGKILATCGGPWGVLANAPAECQGEVILWDVAGRSILRALRGLPERVFAVAFSPDGRRLASGNWAGTISVWDLKEATTDRPSEGTPNKPRTSSGLQVPVGGAKPINSATQQDRACFISKPYVSRMI